MEKKIFCGRGNHIPYADCMELLNASFNFTSPENKFETFLPKLYREELRPQDQNYFVTEDGTPVAAVGAYDHELRVCGRTLACRGIGNVAVHPDHRSKGYMNLAMNATMRDMVTDGVAISTLGGRRQRYLYFGYDKAGPVYSYSISRENMRHVFGDLSSPFSLREVTDPADAIINKIIELNESRAVTPIRKKEEYLYIANSWGARLIAAMDGERFVGYFILNKRNTATEIDTVLEGDFLPLIRSIYAFLDGGFGVTLLPHQIAFRKALTEIAEDMTVGTAMHFNILNYQAVVDAFLALKLTYEKLPDCEISLLIHGYAKDERIKISVKSGIGSVTNLDTAAPVDYELSHQEAISFLFSPISPIREMAREAAKLLFPLPICMRHADEV